MGTEGKVRGGKENPKSLRLRSGVGRWAGIVLVLGFSLSFGLSAVEVLAG
jgi:hypothetical protein